MIQIPTSETPPLTALLGDEILIQQKNSKLLATTIYFAKTLC
jgi:hypothetical protein